MEGIECLNIFIDRSTSQIWNPLGDSGDGTTGSNHEVVELGVEVGGEGVGLLGTSSQGGEGSSFGVGSFVSGKCI